MAVNVVLLVDHLIIVPSLDFSKSFLDVLDDNCLLSGFLGDSHSERSIDLWFIDSQELSSSLA